MSTCLPVKQRQGERISPWENITVAGRPKDARLAEQRPLLDMPRIIAVQVHKNTAFNAIYVDANGM